MTTQEAASSASEQPTRRAARFDTALFDRIGHGVCITGPTIDEPGPVIEYVNTSYLDMFCCERADVVGRSPRFAQGALTDRRVLDRIREHLVGERSCRAQTINYRWDGAPFRLRWTIDPIRHDDELSGFIAIMQDVTIDERVRRRLVALDTFLAQGRLAVQAADADRIDGLAMAMCGALEPMLDEIGEATVETAGAVVATPTRPHVGSERLPAESIVVADRVRISLTIHPDGASLLDRVAIDELCDQLAWFADLDRRA